MPTFSQRQVLLVISWVIIFGGLLLVIPLRLLPSLLAGLLVFELVNMLTPQLQRLIEGRRARWLAMEVEETKIQLTHAENRHVPLDRIEAGLSVELSRALFESAIDNLLERVRNSVTQLLTDADVRVDQVDTVFFTGGSSGIPALRNSVSAMLPNARHVEGNIFGSIGSGLAIEAAKRYGSMG
jgi:hypothetical chaperone protein